MTFLSLERGKAVRLLEELRSQNCSDLIRYIAFK